MTPTTTGTVILTLIEDEPADPRKQTVAYFKGAIPFGADDHARPAGADRLAPGESVEVGRQPSLLELAELAAIHHRLTTHQAKRLGEAVAELSGRLEVALGQARTANHHALEALKRERSAVERAEQSDALYQLAHRVAIVAQGVADALIRRRPQKQTIDAALDRAARRITGRSSREVARHLDWQTSAFPDDEETIVKDPPLDPDQIAAAVRTRRQIGLETDPLVALADIGYNLVGLERERGLIEAAGGMVPYQLTVAIDTAQRALARAVTP